VDVELVVAPHDAYHFPDHERARDGAERPGVARLGPVIP